MPWPSTEIQYQKQNRVGVLGIASGSALIAIGALFYHSSLMPGPRVWRVQMAEYLFVFALSVVLIIIYRNFAPQLRLRRILGLPYLIFPCAVLLFGAVYKLGMHQFGGWDEGVVVHAAAYYAQGFKPYSDFFSSLPPLFMMWIRVVALYLGVSWASFALFTALYAAITCMWVFGLLRLVSVPRHQALVITIAVEACTMFLIPFWWFNNITSLAVALLLLSVVACLQEGEKFLPWISLAFSFGIFLTAKPNAGPGCLMLIPLFATRSKSRWLKASLACVVALAVAATICSVAQTAPLDLLRAYAEVAKLRGSPLKFVPFKEMPKVERMAEASLVLFTTAYLLYLLVQFARSRPHRWHYLAVCVVGTVVGVEMALTNSEFKTTDLIVMLVLIALLSLRPWDGKKAADARKSLLPEMIILFLVMSGYFGVIHLRIRTIGESSYYEPLPTQPVRSGFFKGLEAGPRLLRVQQQTANALALYPSRTVFFGPRMEFEYRALQRRVMPRMPLFWAPGDVFSPARFPGILEQFRVEDPDLLIFLKDDYTGMGPVADYIRTAPIYERIDDYQDLTVYVRKRATPVAGTSTGSQKVDASIRSGEPAHMQKGTPTQELP